MALNCCAASFFGYVRGEDEAYEVFRFCSTEEGNLHIVTSRLTENNKAYVAAGQIYVYDEHKSQIQRWTDGGNW